MPQRHSNLFKYKKHDGKVKYYHKYNINQHAF